MVFVLIMVLIGLGIAMTNLPDFEDDTTTAQRIVNEVFEKLVNETLSSEYKK